MSMSGTLTPVAETPLLALVDDRSGQHVMSCYQCGKCTAGCPMAHTVAVGPRQVMRAVQVGLRGLALNNDLIWMCLACHTCSVRCPREIDVAGVMEALRLLAVEQGVQPEARDLAVFHRVFLASVKRGGRVHELGVGGMYNLLSKRPLHNLGLLPKMLAKGKLELMPARAKGAAEVKAIFERVAEIEGRSVELSLDGNLAKGSAVAAAAIGIGVVAGAKALRRREDPE